MSTRAQIREVEAPAQFSTPQRATLAAVINIARDVRRKEAELREALRRATDHATKTRRRLEEASYAVATAKEATALRATEAATNGSAPPTDNSIRVARAMVTEAQDDLDTARVAITTLEATVERAATVARKADEKVSVAVENVMVEELRPLLTKAREAQRSANRSRLAVLAFVDELEKQPWKKASYGPVFEDAECFLRTDPKPGAEELNVVTLLKNWIHELQEDANAPIPE